MTHRNAASDIDIEPTHYFSSPAPQVPGLFTISRSPCFSCGFLFYIATLLFFLWFFLNLKREVLETKKNLSELEIQVTSLFEVMASYSQRKMTLEVENSQEKRKIETNLELLRADLLFSLQNYLLSFHNEVISKELQRETDSVRNIEAFVLRFLEDRRNFEEKYQTINVADAALGAKVFKYPHSEIWTVFSYKYQRTKDPADKFEEIENVIDFARFRDAKCYKANGKNGSITLQLKEKHLIFAFAYEHKFNGGENREALRRFEVFGMLNAKGNDFLEENCEEAPTAFFLGAFSFTAGKKGFEIAENEAEKKTHWKINEGNRLKQYFLCVHENCRGKRYKSLKIEYENHGEEIWTSVCRFEVLVKA